MLDWDASLVTEKAGCFGLVTEPSLKTENKALLSLSAALKAYCEELEPPAAYPA